MSASISGRFISMVIVCPPKRFSLNRTAMRGLGQLEWVERQGAVSNAVRDKGSIEPAESLFRLHGFAPFDHIARGYLEHCRIGFRAGDILHPNFLRAFPRVLARDRQIYL